MLRADIHTLFDLNLLGINPENFRVAIADKLRGTEYEVYHNTLINIDKRSISLEALKKIHVNSFSKTNNYLFKDMKQKKLY